VEASRSTHLRRQILPIILIGRVQQARYLRILSVNTLHCRGPGERAKGNKTFYGFLVS
jgi:hypothetical protein